MTAATQAGALSRVNVNWPAIDWQQAHCTVRRLQARIRKTKGVRHAICNSTPFTCFAELLLELFHQRPCRLRLGHPYFTGLIPPTHRRVQSNQPGQTTLIAANIARRLLPRVLMWRRPPKISSLGLRVEARIQPGRQQ